MILMSNALVIIGAGGFGREALDVALADSEDWNVVGIIDDGPSPENLKRLADRNVPYLGTENDVVGRFPHLSFVVAIGDPLVRRTVAIRLRGTGWREATLVHPSSVIGSLAKIGPGSVICAGVRISTNVNIGSHSHVNPGAIIGHDAKLGDYVSVNPGAIISGDVHVGDVTLIGAGSVILQGLCIGSNSVIGASACVTKDVRPAVTVMGIPAK